jgi:hypothetical protein
VPAITRVDIAASDANGLHAASQIVVHRPQTISRAKVSRVIGRADDETNDWRRTVAAELPRKPVAV